MPPSYSWSDYQIYSSASPRQGSDGRFILSTRFTLGRTQMPVRGAKAHLLYLRRKCRRYYKLELASWPRYVIRCSAISKQFNNSRFTATAPKSRRTTSMSGKRTTAVGMFSRPASRPCVPSLFASGLVLISGFSCKSLISKNDPHDAPCHPMMMVGSAPLNTQYTSVLEKKKLALYSQ